MAFSHALLILLAGLGAGAINAVVGSGTLVTFPTLVAMGYPPVTSTMSNAVGLVAGNVSSTWGYRRELHGQWDRLRWQIPASVVGAVAGAWLLLHLPEKTFTAIVPVLLIVALIMVVIGPRIQRWAQDRTEKAGRSPGDISAGRMAMLVSSTFVIGVYGGYFTAAQGILMVGVMGALLPESLQRMNAAKNLLTLLVNVVAALAYIGGIPPDKLAGSRPYRGWLAGRRLVRRALRPSTVAECATRRDCRRRSHRALPAADRLAVSPVGRHSRRRTCRCSANRCGR